MRSQRRRCFEEHGFVAGGALLGAQEVELLRTEFDRIFPDQTIAARPPHKHVKDGSGGEFYAVYGLHRRSAAFDDVVRHPHLVEMLADITGRDSFRVLADQVQYKPATTGGWNGWHRDMPSFPLIRPYTALTAWIALDDATAENGCLRMVPGSHLWGDASDLAGDAWGLARLPEVYHGHLVRPVLRPVRTGEVHFHHDMTWHCSGPNKTGAKRRAFAILYIGAHECYRAGGKIAYGALAHGASMETVAPVLVRTR